MFFVNDSLIRLYLTSLPEEELVKVHNAICVSKGYPQDVIIPKDLYVNQIKGNKEKEENYKISCMYEFVKESDKTENYIFNDLSGTPFSCRLTDLIDLGIEEDLDRYTNDLLNGYANSIEEIKDLVDYVIKNERMSPKELDEFNDKDL